MNILIAEDMEDLLEIIELIVQGAYPNAQIITALDGEVAINKIKENSPFSLIISDYNMPKKNGGDVFVEARKKNPQTPYILVSSEHIEDKAAFKGAQNIYQVTKPFTDKSLIEVVKKALDESVHDKDFYLQKPAPFISIHPSVAFKIQKVLVPLYIRLSDQKFVKVLHAGAIFDSSELDRFKKKNINQLWIEAPQFELFYHEYKKEVLSKAALQSMNEIDTKKKLAMDFEVLSSMGQNFGCKPEVIKETTVLIQNVLALTERTPSLKFLLETSRNDHSSRLANHSILLSIFCVSLLKELGWESQMAKDKLTFACVLHDINLNEELFTTMVTLLMNSTTQEIEQSTNKESRIILEHPLVMSELLSNWQLCPPDVDVIIRQHHEKPDGTGFPFGIKALQISPLASVLILAEDVLLHMDQNFGANPKSYLESKKDYYNHGEFKAIFQAALNLMSHSHT